jgi:DNA polymerase IV
MKGALCRDCLTLMADGTHARCTACGSPRLLSHPERDDLTIAHIDCDAFFAAVEKRDHPELRDKPVIIGGGKRGVVSTACYIARTYGVRSAMPMFKALAACPQAVVIRPDLAKYSAVGREVRTRMQALTPLVEAVSIDEAFLDLSGTQRLHNASPAATLARFAHQIEHDLGITVSVGLSYCKFLAKIASDLDKPRGFAIIGKAEAVSFLANKPIGIIPGVGPATRKKLEQAGVVLMRDITRMTTSALAKLVGSDAERLIAMAAGIDNRKIRLDRETKSISGETTFEHDVSGLDELEPVLWRMCEKVALRLRKAELGASTVTLKMKTTNFESRTRARSGLAPTQLALRLFEAAHPLLKLESRGEAFRLLGVSASDFSPAGMADKGDLVDTSAPRQAQTERAIDRLREKFGKDAVMRGIDFGSRRK